MTRNRFFSISTLLALALIATACAGGPPITSWPGITVAGDTAYIAYGQQIHALQIDSGAERWAFPQERDTQVTFYAEPAVAGDFLIAGGYSEISSGLNLNFGQQTQASVYGVNLANGTQAWKFAEAGDHIVGGALVADGTAYVPSADYNLYALKAATGEKLWTFASKQAIWATPLLDGGRLYVPSLDHHLYALRPSDGSVIWDTQLGGAIAGTPALADGALIVGAFDNKLYAVSAEDGSVKWTQPTEGWVWSGPLVTDGTLYYGDLAGWLYAADAATGDVKWQVKPGGAIRGTPALADGTLYVATQIGFIHARSAADGSAKWEKEIGGQLLTAPIVVDGRIIVAAYGAKDNKIVFALDAANGNEKWNFVPPK